MYLAEHERLGGRTSMTVAEARQRGIIGGGQPAQGKPGDGVPAPSGRQSRRLLREMAKGFRK